MKYYNLVTSYNYMFQPVFEVYKLAKNRYNKGIQQKRKGQIKIKEIVNIPRNKKYTFSERELDIKANKKEVKGALF